MIEAYVRAPYQKLCVDPIAKAIAEEYSPNLITLLAGLSGLLIIPALAWGFVGLACLLLALSGYLDTLDGTVARMSNRSTPVGSMLDIVCDRIVEFAVVFALYLVDPINRGEICFLMLGSILVCVTTFLVVGIYTPNESVKGFHYSPGLIERCEAFFFFFAMIIFPEAFFGLGISFVLLVLVTAGMRIAQFYYSQE